MIDPVIQALEVGDLASAKKAYFAMGAVKAIQVMDMEGLSTMLGWPGIDRAVLSTPAGAEADSILHAMIAHVPENEGLPCFRKMIEMGVDLECRNAERMTPLLFAIIKNRPAYLRTLVAVGADAKITGGLPWEMSALNIAIRAGMDIEGLTCLLSAGVDPNGCEGIVATPLMDAADMVGQDDPVSQRAIEAAVCLIDHGADINAANPEYRQGKPVLFTAIQTQRLDFVKILLDKGADPNFTTYLGVSPLAQVVQKRALPVDLDATDLEIMDALLRAGANPNEVYQDGGTMIHRLVENPNKCGEAMIMSVIEKLIGAGADPNIPNADGDSVVDLANESSQFSQGFMVRLERLCLNAALSSRARTHAEAMGLEPGANEGGDVLAL